MMPTKTLALPTLSAFLAVAAISLAGCSSQSAPSFENGAPVTDEADTAQIYQFDDMRVTKPSEVPTPTFDGSKPLVLRLSDELKSVASADVNSAVESFTVTAKSFSSGICRTDIRIAYADGGYEALQEAEQESERMTVERAKQALADEREIDAEWAVFEEPTVPDIVPAGSGWADAKIVKELPSDDALEPGERYYLEDGSGLSITEECGESVGTLYFEYPDVHENNGFFDATRSIALVEIAVDSAGTGDSTSADVALHSTVNARVGVTGKWTELTR